VVQPLFIPNAFTPNGDGVHDLWEISGLERFSNLSVEIFNRWGQIVYKSTGTYKPWDGTKNGVMLPVSTYYYVIDGGGGSIPITGSVLLSK
jgi:gliding motility-associated-like protein